MRIVKKDDGPALGTFKLGNEKKGWSNTKRAIVGGIFVFVLILLIVVSAEAKSTADDNKPDPKPVRPNPHGYDESILDTQALFNTEPVCELLDDTYKKVE